MRLILTGLLAGLKRSAAPFLLLFAAMLCWSGVLAPFAWEETQPAPIQIGVLDEEQGAFSPLLLSLLQKPLGQAAELKILAPGDPQEGCAAVLILPRGFWQGIMDGENLSPVLRLYAASPLEGLWAGALARSGARTIETAQRQIAGMVPVLREAGLDGRELEAALMRADLSLLDRYLSRGGRLHPVRLSATGALNLGRYLLCSAATILMSAAAFLFWEGFSVLNRFARYAQRPSLFACALLLALVLSAGLWLPVAVLLKGGFPEPHALAALWLSSAGQLLLTVSLPGRGACAPRSARLWGNAFSTGQRAARALHTQGGSGAGGPDCPAGRENSAARSRAFGFCAAAGGCPARARTDRFARHTAGGRAASRGGRGVPHLYCGRARQHPLSD